MPAKKRVLRTGIPGDVYIVNDRLTITSAGTEVPDSQADDIVAQAARVRVRLYDVEPAEQPTKSEGSAGQ